MNTRLYRCGHCGIPTDTKGKPLEDKRFEKAVKILERYGDKRTTPTECGCEQEQGSMMRVTHEMAMDAGDPRLEGQWVSW
jgi:hypothetical protein